MKPNLETTWNLIERHTEALAAKYRAHAKALRSAAALMNPGETFGEAVERHEAEGAFKRVVIPQKPDEEIDAKLEGSFEALLAHRPNTLTGAFVWASHCSSVVLEGQEHAYAADSVAYVISECFGRLINNERFISAMHSADEAAWR